MCRNIKPLFNYDPRARAFRQEVMYRKHHRGLADY